MKRILCVILIIGGFIGCSSVKTGMPPEARKHRSMNKEERQMLSLINIQRSKGAVCGGVRYGPTHQLSYNGYLHGKADYHSIEMAIGNFFSHSGTKDFLSRTSGYGGARAENIAAGNKGAADTFRQLMKSAPHCRNIMNPGYRYVGIARAYSPKSRFKWYWTLDFGE